MAATGLTVAAKAGQTGQPRRPPAVQEGAFPGPETGRWEARSSPRGVPGRWPEGPAGPEGHESQGEKPTLTGGHPYPPPPADTSAGVFCLPLKPPGRPLEGRGRGGGLLPLGPRGGGLLGPLEAGRGGLLQVHALPTPRGSRGVGCINPPGLPWIPGKPMRSEGSFWSLFALSCAKVRLREGAPLSRASRARRRPGSGPPKGRGPWPALRSLGPERKGVAPPGQGLRT